VPVKVAPFPPKPPPPSPPATVTFILVTHGGTVKLDAEPVQPKLTVVWAIVLVDTNKILIDTASERIIVLRRAFIINWFTGVLWRILSPFGCKSSLN
jgi:hypothetical protein